MLRWRVALGLLLLLTALAALPVHAAPPYGKLTGVVVDPAGIPQMGATVWVLAETAGGPAPLQLLTNERGLFSTERVPPGLYSVRVTLAGFLPTVQPHVRIVANLATILKIELDSVFSSLDRLRRRPDQPMQEDEWMWVLRTSPGTRPVLRLVEGEVVLEGETPQGETAKKQKPHGRMELTAGARRPGSASNLADAPSSAFAYEQKIGHNARLMFAGQVSYEHSAAGGFATMWLPSGEVGKGPETTLVLRQSKLGPGGPTFRGVRFEHSNQLALGDRVTLRYGAEYMLVTLDRSASSLRPRAELTYRVSPAWRASFILASRPWSHAHLPSSALQSALEELDAFPAVLVRDARPVLEGGWHEEIALEHVLGPNASLLAAVFRDSARHTAIFGRGSTNDPDYLQDFFSNAFAYDGGELSSTGTRIAYRQKFSDELEAALVYAWAAALVPDEMPSNAELRDALHARHRHSLAARVSTRLPRLRTQLVASYKWISGPVVSRQDPFGEIAFQMDPNLNLSFRQPLPSFSFLPAGRFEALADFRNLLAQGYVPMSTRDGQVVLIPAFRSFRGGVTFQF